MSRRALQVATSLLAAIPVGTGVVTLMGVADPIYADLALPRHALLDSNLRFFGGVWLVLGLSMVWLVPRIEHETTLFRLLWLMVFAGGVGRLLSMLWTGMPPWPFVAFTLLEIVGAPLFMVWQTRVAHAEGHMQLPPGPGAGAPPQPAHSP
jgi:hypothetical protein